MYSTLPSSPEPSCVSQRRLTAALPPFHIRTGASTLPSAFSLESIAAGRSVACRSCSVAVTSCAVCAQTSPDCPTFRRDFPGTSLISTFQSLGSGPSGRAGSGAGVRAGGAAPDGVGGSVEPWIVSSASCFSDFFLSLWLLGTISHSESSESPALAASVFFSSAFFFVSSCFCFFASSSFWASSFFFRAVARAAPLSSAPPSFSFARSSRSRSIFLASSLFCLVSSAIC